MKTQTAPKTELEASWSQWGSWRGPDGPTVLRAAISEETARLCLEQYGGSLRAVVLTGSLARSEATFIEEEGRCHLLGDAEFLLIFETRAALPGKLSLNAVCQSLERALSRRRVLGRVKLSAVHPDYLRKLRPHIFAYELQKCGRVIWGDSQVLSLVPKFSASHMPLEDAWRLLCNRMIEQLEVLDGLEDRPMILPPETFYRTIKLYLDMATSFLLFTGNYAPTYAQRAEELKTLTDTASGWEGWPFDLRSFCDRVTACTGWKLFRASLGGLSTTALENGDGFSFWAEAIAYARLLWRWELALLTGTTVQVHNRELLGRWMKCQPPAQRLRGWLYVMRRQGWHRSWRNWPRWGRILWKASPRYLIYAAAGELFFRLPCLLKPASERPRLDVDWEKVRAWLPVLPGSEPSRKFPNWRLLAAEIAWNYQHFLIETRS